MDGKDFTHLTKVAKMLRQKADKDAGRYEQLLKDLKEEWKCKSLEDAEKLLKKLKMEKADLEEEIGPELEQLKKDFPELFEAKDE